MILVIVQLIKLLRDNLMIIKKINVWMQTTAQYISVLIKMCVCERERGGGKHPIMASAVLLTGLLIHPVVLS